MLAFLMSSDVKRCNVLATRPTACAVERNFVFLIIMLTVSSLKIKFLISKPSTAKTFLIIVSSLNFKGEAPKPLNRIGTGASSLPPTSGGRFGLTLTCAVTDT